MRHAKVTDSLRFLCLVVALLLPALYNQYPFVTSDTGAYINNAYQLQMPYDRTLTYSYFILFSSFRISLWLPIIVQCMLLAGLIWSFTERILHEKMTNRLVAGLSLMLWAGTSCAWFAGQLMPDIFTPVVFLSGILYMHAQSKAARIGFAVICMTAILMHNANMVTALIFFTGITIVSFKSGLHFRSSLRLLLMTIGCWLFLSFLHFIAGDGFRPSKSAHVFLIAKMSENGILKKYLDTHCATNQFLLCQFKENLPAHAWDFVWDNQGAFAKTGYWDSSKAEYTSIIKGSLQDPYFLYLHIRESIRATAIQFSLNEIGDGLVPHLEGTNPFWKVEQYYRSELPLYRQSKQNRALLSFGWINIMQQVVFWGSMIIFAGMFFARKEYKPLLPFFYMALFFCICNAWSTATLANILGRLNARCIWLLPVLSYMMVAGNLRWFSPNLPDKSAGIKT